MNLQNKTALVTGASRGIGREIAISFAAAGARVALHYNQSRKAAEEVFSGLAGEGHTLIQADISDPVQVETMVETAVERLGSLDILVNNAAAVFEKRPLADLDYEAWQVAWKRTLDVNLTGAANTAFCAARHMIPKRSGTIINIGSRGAYRGETTALAYAAGKAGLHALSQSLAKYLGRFTITVTAVAPGFVDTDMSREDLAGEERASILGQSPLGRVASPQEIAHTVLFLAAPGSEWLTGAVVDCNGASYLR
ncbi:SDR family oxidoreductase [bacterium]|nr:SDR family oxidoreductase [bacterium]